MNDNTIKVIERLTKMLEDTLAKIESNKYTINSQRDTITRYQREMDKLKFTIEELKNKKGKKK